MENKQDTQLDVASGPQSEHFVVRRGGSMWVLALIFLVAFGGVSVWQTVQTGLAESRNILIAGVFSVLAGIVLLLDCKNHRLEVDGEELRYTSMFGQTTSFRVEEIGGVGLDFLENLKLLTADGKLLARLERSMTHYETLLHYLENHHVVGKR